MVIGSSIATDLNFASLSPGQNINTNSNSNSFSGPVDMRNYLGVVAVTLSSSNGAGGTITNVWLTSSSSNDGNVSNMVNHYGLGINTAAAAPIAASIRARRADIFT